MELNTPQQNRITLSIEFLRYENNYFDCDVIEDAAKDLEKVNTLKEALEAMDYAISALNYRNGTTGRLKAYRREIEAYTSLLDAIKLQDSQAAAYFKKEAADGKQVRLV